MQTLPPGQGDIKSSSILSNSLQLTVSSNYIIELVPMIQEAYNGEDGKLRRHDSTQVLRRGSSSDTLRNDYKRKHSKKLVPFESLTPGRGWDTKPALFAALNWSMFSALSYDKKNRYVWYKSRPYNGEADAGRRDAKSLSGELQDDKKFTHPQNTSIAVPGDYSSTAVFSLKFVNDHHSVKLLHQKMVHLRGK